MVGNGESRLTESKRDAHLETVISSRSQPIPCGACPVRELAVCGALAPDELATLAAIVHEATYGPHQAVFHEGDEAESFFIITSGVASVSKFLVNGRRQITGFLYPSDFFGLVIEGQYVNSVTAITQLQLCHFMRRQYEALLERFPKLETRLLGHASNELVEAQEQMVLLGQKTATEKVASFLLMISGRARRTGQPDNPTWIPMTREDMGDYLGLTTETTSRTITRLEALGAIRRLRDMKIELVDREVLQEIADGE
jgi:CRP/FNR family transcriptional regulator, anaerobic regulatory protein